MSCNGTALFAARRTVFRCVCFSTSCACHRCRCRADVSCSGVPGSRLWFEGRLGLRQPAASALPEPLLVRALRRVQGAS